MEKTNHFKIAAVPEHFTLPLHIGKSDGTFEKEGVSIDIIEHPKGTGSMVQSLRDKSVKVAIALTEGLIADKMKNKDANYSIIAEYVSSQLEWATVARPDSDIKKLDDLKGTNIGISRFGSGSHVMSYVLGKKYNFDMENDVVFKPVGGMEDLIQGVENKEIDSFMWERFTIKPGVDSNRLKYVGYTKTPWPCFCIAIRNDVLKSTPAKEIEGLLRGIQQATKQFKQNRMQSLEIISKTCRLNEEDAKTWFDGVKFSSNGALKKSMLESTRNTLLEVGALKEKSSINTLLDNQYTIVAPESSQDLKSN